LVMSTLPPMTEASSIRTCYWKIGKRSPPCRTAIQNWGKLMIVYKPSDADIVILVTSRPSEDLVAVYDAHLWPSGSFLWRVTGRDGLQSGETPLVTQFEKGFESVQKHK
jgi:hypothetical protein